MKHLGFDTLHRVSGPCGAFLCCCALAFCLTLVPAFAVEEDVPSVEFLSLDPEPVTGESLGFATAVVRSPSDGSLWIGMAEKGLLRIGRNGRRIRYTQQSGHLPSDQIKGLCASSDGVIYILDARGQVMRYSSVEGFKSLSERGIIEVAPLAYMRGRTLNDAYIILDEAQNCTIEQMKMFLTRFGEGSRVVVTGDITQIDLPQDKQSGLIHALRVLSDVEGIATVHLTARDVVRHEMVQRIVLAYERAAAKAAERNRERANERMNERTAERRPELKPGK